MRTTSRPWSIGPSLLAKRALPLLRRRQLTLIVVGFWNSVASCNRCGEEERSDIKRTLSCPRHWCPVLKATRPQGLTTHVAFGLFRDYLHVLMMLTVLCCGFVMRWSLPSAIRDH